jgi:hypothetical protein
MTWTTSASGTTAGPVRASGAGAPRIQRPSSTSQVCSTQTSRPLSAMIMSLTTTSDVAVPPPGSGRIGAHASAAAS